MKESFDTDAATVSLEAHTHEQAATVSLDIVPKAGSAISFESLVAAMQAIAVGAEEAGGIVGHLKAYARQDDAFAHASVTAPNLPPTCEGDITTRFGEAATIQLVSIVMLIDQDALASLSRTCAAEALKP